jgi:putative hemolysin
VVRDRALEAQVSLALADDGGRCRALSACQVCHGDGGASSMVPPLEGGGRGMGMLPAGEGVEAWAYDRI